MARTVYHVTPRSGGKWAVIKASSSRASSTHRKKSAAVRKAKKLAKDRKPSAVKIHNRNGRIHKRNTYEDDPYPPRG